MSGRATDAANGLRAAVIGAGGAIGGALVEHLAADEGVAAVFAFSRDERPVLGKVKPGFIDVGVPATIAEAARAIEGPLDLVLIATGMLHEGERRPERSLRELDADWLARSFAVNAIGPALALQQFTPLLRREGRAVIAALSARVGSIGDNRLGGWYGYRASKAALAMLVRCAAIEIARTRPAALCVALHPGTVDSGLSRPFQAAVPEGKLFTPAFAAERLLAVLDGLRPEDSGFCFAWDGTRVEA